MLRFGLSRRLWRTELLNVVDLKGAKDDNVLAGKRRIRLTEAAV